MIFKGDNEMIRVSYREAVEVMEKGLRKYLPEDAARQMAEIFAGNSADGVASHGMNRYCRYLSDMEKGLCNASVLQAERVAALGGLERWDAHFGVGPLIAVQAAERAMALAKEHGIGCVAVGNNSHWLRAGRYALMMADAGFAGMCFTNTCMNLTCYGAKAASTGNNPIAMAVPGPEGSLLMDMAVSQYAYGKLEIMAQEGKQLPSPMGYDTQGNLTTDPGEICRSGLMLPMAMWKGSALSIMLDLLAVTLSGGRTSREIGTPAAGEAGMSQVFLCMQPEALGGGQEIRRRIGETLDFLHSLPGENGKTGGVRAPGERLALTREENLREGLPVTEATWENILKAVNQA